MSTPIDIPNEDQFRGWDEEQVHSFFSHYPWFPEGQAVIAENGLGGSQLLDAEPNALIDIIPKQLALNILLQIEEIRSKGAYSSIQRRKRPETARSCYIYIYIYIY
jgi:hypothetical protein